MKRKQFTFYRSFWDACQKLREEDRPGFLMAVCAYALDGEEIPLSDSTAASFCLAKPVLDSSRRKAESGRKGGSKPKANEKQMQANQKQTKANRKQSESKKEKEREGEIENEIEGEVENECYIHPSPSDDGDAPQGGKAAGFAGVVGIVEGVVGELSARQKDALLDFADSMGEACILKALDAAQDAGRLNFGYIRGALENKLAQGVKSAEDWDKAEARFQAAKGVGKASKPGADYQPSTERIQKNSDWLEDFLIGQEGRT